MFLRLSWYCMKMVMYAMYYTILTFYTILALIPKLVFGMVNNKQKGLINMTLKEIEFLKGICDDLKLHANKNASALESFIKEQETLGYSCFFI